MAACRSLLLAVGLLVVSTSSAFAFETELLQNNGPGANRVNIYILGDGYRAQDQTLLRQRAIALADNFWRHSAFTAYRQYFNVKLIKTVSADDGAVNGANPPSQPTIFQSFFNCAGIDRLLCIGDTARLFDVLTTDAPEYDGRFDIVLITVNDAKYGGAGATSYATTSAEATAPAIAVHELGHSFGGLADEYDYGGSQSTFEFQEPNVTIISQRSQVKWNVWINPSTPVPTPPAAGFENVIGVFEGANKWTTGHFRPKENCIMRSLEANFCSVCGEALVWNVYDKTDPIEVPSPATPAVTIPAGGTRRFSFTGPKPIPNTLNATWFVKGASFATGVTQIDVTAGQLGPGTHTIELRTQDQTALVRRDPNTLLRSQFAWTVTVPSGGTGGASGTGGRIGTGGATGSGGRIGTGGAVGTGGRIGTGGAVGSGGRIGTGGAVGTGGRIGTGGATGSGGAGSGTTPCSSLCTSPVNFSSSSFQSGNLGTAVTCHQTVANLTGANCGNFAAGRTFRVNNVPVTCGGNIPLPAKRNGGYCFQASAGDFAWAYFSTW